MKTSGSAPPFLLIGYGNSLRGDDAAGYRLALDMEKEALPDLRCIAVHQLTPELAADLAAARHVFFADARPTQPQAPDLVIEAVTTESPNSVASHGCSPQALLQLAKTLYHTCPSAQIIGIIAHDFRLGESMTESTRHAINAARDWIRNTVTGHA
ncbi:MAG TPA: hydrogenase maturation protease [Kiritimatiellia bacterium]|nr:hydrogenase maturation protease [Kiritimatiellia bacterium]HMP00263.1 hydrogenase maturation protease [Kiritimatiellia bacterium]HMP97509.1 hydrogenase maturation protease [Kiritimatiellia bacterium]